MPNWCSNKLVISGSKEEIARFAQTLGEDGKFSFSQTVPMPKELEGIVSGPIPVVREVPVEDENNPPEDARKSFETGKLVQLIEVPQAKLDEYMQLYGVTDWYGWNILNWGTKWDLSDVKMTVEDEELYCWFDTAWSPPNVWVTSVSQQFPELTFTLRCAEGGVGFYGSFTVVNGAIIEDIRDCSFYKPDLTEDDWETKEGDELLVDEVREFLSEHGLHSGG